jgi:hypothetical protein
MLLHPTPGYLQYDVQTTGTGNYKRGNGISPPQKKKLYKWWGFRSRHADDSCRAEYKAMSVDKYLPTF